MRLQDLAVVDHASTFTHRLTIDGYVPVQVRSYEMPPPATRLRFGDLRASHLELVVEAHCQRVRGATLLSTHRIAPWPNVNVIRELAGAPIIGGQSEPLSVVDLGAAFDVAMMGTSVLMYWGAVVDCVGYTSGRVTYLASSGRLVGILGRDLTPEETELLGQALVRQ